MSDPRPDADRRAIFIDIDDTLVDQLGRVPASVRAAVPDLRASGHKVLLCTGRSLGSIWTEIAEIGWDGVVGAAGAYVEVDGQVLRHVTIPVDSLRHAVEFFTAHQVDFLLETTEGVHASPGAPAQLCANLARLAPDAEIRAQVLRSVAAYILELEAHDQHHSLVRDDVHKISFLASALSQEEVVAGLGPGFDFVPASIAGQGGELSVAGVHKASGAAVALAGMGMQRRQSIAFGDGWNDLEMLEYAEVGVAMGSAPDRVRAAADLIVGRPEQDGIVEGLRRLGLL